MQTAKLSRYAVNKGRPQRDLNTRTALSGVGALQGIPSVIDRLRPAVSRSFRKNWPTEGQP